MKRIIKRIILFFVRGKYTNNEVILALCLDKYIREGHTQEECIGFIDGFNAALNSKP